MPFFKNSQTARPRACESRRAIAQPRFLLGGAAVALLGGAWAAIAQNVPTTPAPAPVPMVATAASDRIVTLDDLPGVVQESARRRQIERLTTAPQQPFAAGRVSARVIGDGRSGFNLVEVDLTPNTPSDERNPVYSPGGDFIAFESNGRDTNADGRIDAVAPDGLYRIFVMNRDGSNQRQLTGFNRDNISRNDVTRNQRNPSWAPNGNSLVYVDGAGDSAQLYIVGFNAAFFNDPGALVPATIRVTNYTGNKRDPAFSPAGQSIVFASDTDPRSPLPPSSTGRQFDLFRVPTDGNLAAATRLTGGTNDPVGNQTNDWAPAFDVNDGSTIYFSSNRDNSTVLATGRRIYRTSLSATTAPTRLTDPTTREAGSVNDIDDSPTSGAPGDSIDNDIPANISFQSNSLIDSSDTNRDFNIWNLSGTEFRTDDESNVARVVTNILSSPRNFQDSDIGNETSGADNVTEDTVNDVEPDASRRTTTARDVATLVFASQRRFSPNPAANRNGTVNPNGSYDIITTQIADVTPPILVPISEGNQQFPVIAPRDDSPLPNSPRTPDGGLTPNGTTRFAFVLRDLESGLEVGQNSQSIRVIVRKPDAPNRYSLDVTEPNDDNLLVQVARELPNFLFNFYNSARPALEEDDRPDPATDAVPPDGSYTGFQVYDDGPVAAGGNERQADAVAGDGEYYIEKQIQAPLDASDYYMDILVTDRAGNTFNYDNVWGFTTLDFIGNTSGRSDLFVSDYTVGQSFPATTGDSRFFYMDAVESYWLTNPGGSVLTGGTGGDGPVDSGVASVPETFGQTGFFDESAVDVWRVLCRGGVTQEVLNNYLPRATLQINPASPDETTPSRVVPVSNSSVIYAAPYAGTVFAGSGTLVDPIIQNRLSNFLQNGGRLFISGRDIPRVLSIGNVSNFLTQELAASYSGNEVRGEFIIDPGPGGFLDYRNNGGAPQPDFNRLQIGYRPQSNPDAFHYDDSALNQTPFAGAAAVGIDTITPGSVNDGTVTTAYTLDSEVVGQRIVRNNRNNGFQSRAVFFSFGFEGVNRRYRNSTQDWSAIALNTRRNLAQRILSFFKTGIVTGQVINDATNEPIPNFLVQLQGNGETYLARTNATGQYQFNGVPEGGYTITPFVREGNTTPTGFRGGTPVGAFIGIVNGNGLVSYRDVIQSFDSNNNLRVIPLRPGSVRGFVTADDATTANPNGTPGNRGDDFELRDVPVLLRSRQPLRANDPRFPTGGFYAQLTRTNNNGLFTFSNVPALVDYEVVVNPRADSIDQNDFARGGDFPTGVNITYPGGPLRGYDRRVIAFDNLPENVAFTVNDNTQATATEDPNAADSGVPIYLPIDRISARVTLQSGADVARAVDNALVILRDTSGAEIARDVIQSGEGGRFDFSSLSNADLERADDVRIIVFAEGAAIERVVTINALGDVVALQVADVTGVVTTNGSGAAGFTVTLIGANGQPVTFSNGPNANNATFARAATTGSNGRYTIRFVPAGTYRVRASGAGGLSQTSQTFTVPTSGVVTAPAINFSETLGSIAGRVTLGGAPVPGATVTLTSGSGAPAPVTTNANGNYSFGALAANTTYTVTVNFTSNGRQFTDSRQVTIGAGGGAQTADFAFSSAPATSASGVVRVNGVPTGGLRVQLLNANGTAASDAVTTNSSGIFTLNNVSAGSYTLSVSGAVGGQTLNDTFPVSIPNTGGATNLGTFNLEAGGLSGRVTTYGNVGVSGATVELLSSRRRSFSPPVRVTTDEIGSFSITELPDGDGRYYLRAEISVNNRRYRSRTVRVDVAGGQLTGVNIELRVPYVTGLVLSNGAPAEGVQVELLDRRGRPLRPMLATLTDENGRYTFFGVRGSSFRVRVTAGPATADAEVRVRRGIGEAPTINLTRQQNSGQVQRANGSPLEGATLLIFSLNGNRVAGPIITDANGNYNLFDLAVGTYTFQVIKSSESLQQSFVVRQGLGLERVVLRLGSGSSASASSASSASASSASGGAVSVNRS